MGALDKAKDAIEKVVDEAKDKLGLDKDDHGHSDTKDEPVFTEPVATEALVADAPPTPQAPGGPPADTAN
jgi:hypothetical protein